MCVIDITISFFIEGINKLCIRTDDTKKVIVY